jgi:hypothetical protein
VGATVSARFLTAPVFAQDSSGNSSQANVKCIAGESCEGPSFCKGGNHSCKGLNSCKGQGLVISSTTQECMEKGGHLEGSR